MAPSLYGRFNRNLPEGAYRRSRINKNPLAGSPFTRLASSNPWSTSTLRYSECDGTVFAQFGPTPYDFYFLHPSKDADFSHTLRGSRLRQMQLVLGNSVRFVPQC